MEEKQIKKYANVMQELGLSALEIEEQGCRLRLERGAGASQAAAPSAAAAVSSDAAPAAAATQDICSPMVGVFYRAPAENAAPFVQVGDCIHKGDVLCLIGAVVYAFHILLTADFTKKEDGLLLGIWQLGFAGLYGLICTMLFETPTLPAAPSQWMAVLGLALICSAFGFVAQPMAQKYTSPEHTGLLFSLEPLFSALFAFLFLQETLSARGYLGAALMMAGVLVASASPEKKEPQAVKN